MEQPRSFWDRIAPLYDLSQTVSRGTERRMIERIRALLPQDAVVLEAAAGTGEISKAIAARVRRVVCMDRSDNMLRLAAKKIQRTGAQNVWYARGDLLQLESRPAVYDAVIAAHVLHLLPAPQKAVQELWRVTRPGGLLILPTYLLGEVRGITGVLFSFYQKLGYQPSRRWTLEEYHRTLCDMCLGTVQCSRIDGPFPVGFAVLQKGLA